MYYAALIVSNNPIDLSGFSNDRSIRHLVSQEFEMGSDISVSGDGWKIVKSAPEHCAGDSSLHLGRGSVLSEVIADWFKNLCRSFNYLPQYYKHL